MVRNLRAAIDLRGEICLDNVDVGGVAVENHDPNQLSFLLALLNSPVLNYYFIHNSVPFRGGFFSANRQYIEKLPIPPIAGPQVSIVRATVETILSANSDVAYWEQLLNGLVYELFFPKDLHSYGIRLFDEMERLRFLRTGDTQSDVLLQAVQHTASVIFRNNHPVYRMLFDLQAVPVVRTIEGKE